MQQFYSKEIFGIQIIAPSKKHFDIIEGYLFALLDLDKRAFLKVIRLMGTIFVTPFNDFYNELFLKNNIWFVDKDFLDKKKNYKGAFISVLVHEAHHCHQYVTGKIEKKSGMVGGQIEKAAYQIQIAFLKKHNFSQELQRKQGQLKEGAWKTDDPSGESDKKYENLLVLYKSGKLKITKV